MVQGLARSSLPLLPLLQPRTSAPSGSRASTTCQVCYEHPEMMSYPVSGGGRQTDKPDWLHTWHHVTIPRHWPEQYEHVGLFSAHLPPSGTTMSPLTDKEVRHKGVRHLPTVLVGAEGGTSMALWSVSGAQVSYDALFRQHQALMRHRCVSKQHLQQRALGKREGGQGRF